ncbi:hypothetical protein ACLBXJ_15570 [Methylobacterium mesophilicum]
MARVTLHPNAKAEIGVAVGTIDGRPLSFVDKTAYLDGEVIPFEEIGYDVSIAVEEAAIRVFGQEWSTDLGRITGMNRRTVTRDRIERFGVAVWVYELLGRAATSPCPKAFGYQLLAAAEFCDRGPYSVYMKAISKWRGADPYERGQLRLVVQSSMEKAWNEIDDARTQREEHEISKNPTRDQ